MRGTDAKFFSVKGTSAKESRMKTLRSVHKFGCRFPISAISLLYKNLTDHIRAEFFA